MRYLKPVLLAFLALAGAACVSDSGPVKQSASLQQAGPAQEGAVFAPEPGQACKMEIAGALSEKLTAAYTRHFREQEKNSGIKISQAEIDQMRASFTPEKLLNNPLTKAALAVPREGSRNPATQTDINLYKRDGQCVLKMDFPAYATPKGKAPAMVHLQRPLSSCACE